MEKVKKEVNTFFLIFRALLFPISLKHETFMILLLSSFRDYSESLHCTLTITFLLFNTDEFKVFLKSLPVREEKFKEMVEKQLQKVREESHVLFDFFFFVSNIYVVILTSIAHNWAEITSDPQEKEVFIKIVIESHSC